MQMYFPHQFKCLTVKFFVQISHLIFTVTLFIRISNFSSVQLLSCLWLFATPWTAAHKASLSITNSWSLLKLMSIESVMPSNHLILCRPLLLLLSIFPSIRVFSNESVLRITWLKYWSFSSSISPTNEYSGLISFRIDWFDLFEVQGTLKSLLQHHNSQVAKKLPANAGGMRCRFDLWVGKIPWSRAWQLTPIFLPGELHGQRSLVVYSPWRHKELDTTEVT